MTLQLFVEYKLLVTFKFHFLNACLALVCVVVLHIICNGSIKTLINCKVVFRLEKCLFVVNVLVN